MWFLLIDLGIIIILGYVLYGLFFSETKLVKMSSIAVLLVVVFILLVPFSQKTYVHWSKAWFQQNSDGIIDLYNSPLKVPKGISSDKYCKQFTRKNGASLNIISGGSDGSVFCGIYAGFDQNNNPVIPFKFLPNGKAEYWAAPGSIIVGPRPKDYFLPSRRSFYYFWCPAKLCNWSDNMKQTN